MNSIFSFFTPKDKKFQPLFEQAGSNVLKIAEALLVVVTTNDLEKRKEAIKEVERLEHVGDDITPVSYTYLDVYKRQEYGERLGVHSKLELTYKRMGDFMKKNCKGYFGYIFTGNPDLAKKIGLKADQKVEFYNGKLDCRLLTYELYDGTRRAEEDRPKAKLD